MIAWQCVRFTAAGADIGTQMVLVRRLVFAEAHVAVDAEQAATGIYRGQRFVIFAERKDEATHEFKKVPLRGFEIVSVFVKPLAVIVFQAP